MTVRSRAVGRNGVSTGASPPCVRAASVRTGGRSRSRRSSCGVARDVGQTRLDAGDLLDATRADVRLGVEAELLLRAEPGDVLIEAVAAFGRNVDPVFLAGVDVHVGRLDDEPGPD